MVTTPELIVLDVNETLSDMAPLGEAFAQEGVPAGLSRTWFAGILRDGFAVAATGGNTGFAEIAQDSLYRLLSEHGISAPGESVERIMGILKSLDVHPDVVPGIEALRQSAELVTLSNGTAQVAETLLSSAGVCAHFSELLSVQEAPAWKPAGSAHDYAASRRGTDPQGMLLVAVHPWDIYGAHQVGLRTAWINRTGAQYPATSPARTWKPPTCRHWRSSSHACATEPEKNRGRTGCHLLSSAGCWSRDGLLGALCAHLRDAVASAHLAGWLTPPAELVRSLLGDP